MAARRLLESKGYAHITARDLVAESGTNLASIGYHFGSKSALLNCAIEAAFEEWADQLAADVMADPDATPLQRGAATWGGMLRNLPARRPMLQAYIDSVAQAQRSPELNAQLAHHLQRVRVWLAQLVAASLGREVEPTDPRCAVVASFLIAVCDGLSLQWLIDPDSAPDGEQLLDALLVVFSASVPERREEP